VLIELAPTAIFGKATAVDDYSVLWQSTEAISTRVVDCAGVWLHVLLSTANSTVVAVQFLDRECWMLRAQPESSLDAAGRPRGFVALGRLKEETALQYLPGGLVAMGRLRLERSPPPPDHIEADFVESSPLDDSTATVVLSVVLEESPARVGKLGEAVAVLSILPPTTFQWIVLLPTDCKAKLPQGRGLVISEDHPQQCPDTIKHIVESYGAERLLRLPLDQLLRLDADPTDRREMIEAALSGDLSPAFAQRASPQMLQWLARTPAGRHAAIEHFPGDALDEWLRSPDARVEDLALVSSRLGRRHRSAVRTLLRGRTDAVAQYGELYPDDVEGVAEMLPESAARTLQRVRQAVQANVDVVPQIQQAEVVELFRTLEGSPLLQSLPLAVLATAAGAELPGSERLFEQAIERRGMPSDVLDALLQGDPLPELPQQAPPLKPSKEWLQGVPAQSWLGNADVFLASPSWKDWWYKVIEVLVSEDRLHTSAVAEKGIECRDPVLLRLGCAPSVLRQLVDPEADLVAIPWQQTEHVSNVADLLDRLVADGTFFDRMKPPLTDESLCWLEEKIEGKPVLRAIQRIRLMLKNGEPVHIDWLRWIARLLPRYRVLSQVSAWASEPFGRERQDAIECLLRQKCLTPKESHWLRALTLTCGALPSAPTWSAGDMLELLPIMDPVRDVLREVLERPCRGPSEDLLLTRLVDVLQRYRVVTRVCPSDDARRLRPDWIRAIGKLPGWEGFVEREGRPQLAEVKRLCQQLLEGKEKLPEGIRGPVSELAEADDDESNRNTSVG